MVATLSRTDKTLLRIQKNEACGISGQIPSRSIL